MVGTIFLPSQPSRNVLAWCNWLRNYYDLVLGRRQPSSPELFSVPFYIHRTSLTENSATGKSMISVLDDEENDDILDGKILYPLFLVLHTFTLMDHLHVYFRARIPLS